MKKRSFLFLILLALCLNIFFAGNLFADAQGPQAFTLSENDNRLTQSYREMYAIPNQYFDASTDRGGEDTLPNAFDGKWNTFYKASQDTNNGSLTINFHQSVNLSAIIFAIAQNTNNSKPNGYPATLTIYADGQLKATIDSTPSINKMLFSFDEFSCTSLQLKFTMNGNYNWCQTASEIIFLQPEVEGINSLFANYSQTELTEDFNSESAINDLENTLRGNINFDTGFKPMLERAKKILTGEVTFQETREFSTQQNAKNKIHQRGDIASYCRTTLKMRYMGTNRQITGIFGRSGQEINVYVEAENSDAPLPKIQFSQFNNYLMDDYGNNTWLGGEQTLSLGKNTFVYPTFNLQGANVIPGGSIYIVNPNTTQQGIVKIYIEGGEEFPVFRINESESDYLAKLNQFTSQSSFVDITEMQGDNVIITVEASRAKNNYATNPEVSPQKNLEKWDEYIKKLLAFDGIALSQNQQYYDEKNEYINVNIRLMKPEPGAAAYAGYEHIGIFVVNGDSSWLDNATQMTQAGWGFAHEIGHMLDLPERTVAECSNNMFSMYALTYITHQLREPSFYENTLQEMLNPTQPSLFNYGERSNYLIWWYIENYFPGYWGKLDNLYRFGEQVEGLTPTEKQVYLSSLATGVDLSYYFEKWGYSLTGTEQDGIFSYNQSSSAFKELMTQKIEEDLIDNSVKPKIWYAQKGDVPSENSQIYNSNQKVNAQIEKIDNGYKLTLPQPTSQAHLGYEIYIKTQQGYKLLAFTYENVYEDLNEYEQEPQYEIVAIDTSFNSTAQPGQNPQQTTPGGEVEPDDNDNENEDKNENDKNENPKSNKTGLIVGISVAAVAVLAIAITIIFVIKKRKR